MIKSDARKFIFVHLQKTGGSSIKRALKPNVPDARSFLGTHDFARAGQAALGPKWHDYFTCAMVRNPWARLVSWWSMLSRVNLEKATVNRNNRFWRYVQDNARSFDDFVLKCTDVIDDADGRKSIMFNQLDYLTDHDGQVIVNFVGRLENIAQDAATIFARVGLPGLALPHAVRSKHRHYSHYYTPALRDLVGERHEQDIIHFGYRFEAAPATPEAATTGSA